MGAVKKIKKCWKKFGESAILFTAVSELFTPTQLNVLGGSYIGSTFNNWISLKYDWPPKNKVANQNGVNQDF